MKYTGKLLVNSFCLAGLLALIGMSVAALFHAGFLGKIFGALAIIVLVVASSFTGFMITLYSLERGKIVHANDGKDEFFITIYIGPFEKKIILPYRDQSDANM